MFCAGFRLRGRGRNRAIRSPSAWPSERHLRGKLLILRFLDRAVLVNEQFGPDADLLERRGTRTSPDPRSEPQSPTGAGPPLIRPRVRSRVYYTARERRFCAYVMRQIVAGSLQPIGIC